MNAHRLFVAAGIFHPESGGPATYLYELLPELQKRGWQPRVVTYGSGDVGTYPYPVRRIPRRLLPIRLAHYAAAAYPLLRWADLVYVHTLDLPLMGGKAKRVVKMVGDQAWERAIRKGWIPPSEDIDTFQTKEYGGVVSAQKAARARQMQAMDGVIVPSQYLKRMVTGWGVDEAKIDVVYNALPPHLLASQTGSDLTQAEARKQLNLPDAPTILTAARLTQWKGIDHLITALQPISEVRLIVAGEGELMDTLKAQAAAAGLGERVSFLGKIPRDKLAVYMKAADYLALYSGYEGLSHTLLESLLAGTPIIASDKGGNPEVVQHTINGLLVPYVDIPALTATIEAAFHPGERERMAANNRVGMERFQFETMVKHTSDVLETYL
ncbi:MAG: glycosyltransferase family 4 protein [Chloroflexi bacterium]|nr:glycosyltransferase family 4 protein [Chloroflexota bacterium]MCC6893104.1 glycosyltransferase family 4 protein [Anaerolineae bacterium]